MTTDKGGLNKVRDMTDAEVDDSYNGSKCVYCGYRPELTGHLNIFVINGRACWCCRSCETATIPSLEEIYAPEKADYQTEAEQLAN